LSTNGSREKEHPLNTAEKEEMNLFKFDSESTWAETAASLWRDRLRSKPDLKMCLTTGLTPVPIYAAMIRAVQSGAASFREAEIFLLDEFGGLAADDPGRCVNMLRRDLLDRIDLPPEKFHAIDADAADLDRACREFDDAISGGFDLTLLGIGTNGHIGMNEPGSSADSPVGRKQLAESTIRASARYGSTSPLAGWGAGVGMKRLLESREIWLLANGASKAEIVRRTVSEEISTELPATLLRRHPNCIFFVDPAAAASLS
jgi:glucosamine-6-phosphate deaminase